MLVAAIQEIDPLLAKRSYRLVERLPERVLQEDPELLLYYDNAGPG